MGSVRAGDDIFFTLSMAEVLEKQGHLEDALMIYKILSDSSPWDESLQSKVECLRRQAGRAKAKRGGL